MNYRALGSTGLKVSELCLGAMTFGKKFYNVGVLGQVHIYLDDLLPAVFTWTPLHGVLGPTQPR